MKFIVLLFLLGLTSASAQQVVTEVETFDEVPKFWFEANPMRERGFERSYDRGVMNVRMSNESVFWTYKSHPIDNASDWSVTVRCISRSSFAGGGPGIHVWAPEEHYVFNIAPSMQAYWVGSMNTNTRTWKVYGATEENNNRNVRTDAVKPDGDTNVLTVARRGKKLQYVINGTVVEELPVADLGPIGTSVLGLGVNTSQRVNVDFLDVAVTYRRAEFNVNPQALAGATKTYVENLNSGQSDRYAIIAPNGASMYFVRSIPFSGDDIYYATRETDSTWSTPRPIPGVINNQNHNSVIAVSQDDNELFLWGKYDEMGLHAGFGFSKTRRTADGWDIPTNVEINDYRNKASTREECVSADRTVVILAGEMDSSVGKKDLYASFLQDDGTYSTPKNLGATLNSPFNEGMPYLAADNRTLYFGSSRPGYGDDDIWVSKRLDDTWLNWSVPVNMGPYVNTNAWDGYFSIHPSGIYAYMNSSDGVRNGIMRLRLPQTKESAKLLPEPTVLVRGAVTDAKSGQPIATDVIVRDLKTNAKVAVARSEPAKGKYSIILPSGRSYAFFASDEEYYPVSENIDLRTLKTYREIDRNLDLWPIEVGATVRLNNVFFASGKATIDAESRDELQRLIELMRSRPAMRIEIGGHTDDRGTDEQNMKLSQDRADNVMKYLIQNGISSDRLRAAGYGKQRPLTTERTSEALQRNRRVEFTITGL
ncbi:MAG: OmpA family protein [Candidatus Kapabacteria bacterium]|nr:OmpA family protein [Candidatus Kapabacteria bacterium]